MEYVSLLGKVFNHTTLWLKPYFDWHIIIFIYSFVYFLYLLFVNVVVNKEMRKRKEIVQDIHLYKTTHPAEDYPKVTDEKMKNILHRNQPDYPESYYVALEEIVKKGKGKPLKAVFMVIIQYWLLIALIAYHLGMRGNIPELSCYYYMDIGLIALLLVRKQLWLLRLFFLLTAVIAYRFFTPEALLFIGFVSLYRIIYRLYKKYKK
ncbi:hypothetical protein U8V72_18315 [Priestia filamentosa]|uniref:hypothetical protein n=1 Tax=Priestia filamentosa TaxID=1402861 RepID=UPI003979A607